MVWTKVTVSSYMYYYTVNLSPSVIIRDAVIVKWAVMEQTKRVTFTHTCTLIFFFLSFSKIFILAHYRDYTFGHSSSLQVIVDHCRSLQIIVGHCRSLQIIAGHRRSLQVIPCFSNYGIKISCLYLRKSWQVYLKVSVFSGCQLGEYSPKQVTRTKILVTVASKVVTAWRVNKNLGLLGQFTLLS